MLERVFFDVVDKIGEVRTRSDGDAFLRQVQDSYGFTNVAYAAFNVPVEGSTGVYFQNTYCDPWRSHYIQHHMLNADPVMRSPFMSILPQDWEELAAADAEAASVFAQASEFGISRKGLTVPIRGVHGETAAFSVSALVERREWEALKRIMMRDLQTLANYFHVSVLRNLGHTLTDGGTLSTRELECLKWAAAGKSAWESAMILSVSEKTVAFHLSSARFKLHSVTTTQAVAKAVMLGRISVH